MLANTKIKTMSQGYFSESVVALNKATATRQNETFCHVDAMLETFTLPFRLSHARDSFALTTQKENRSDRGSGMNRSRRAHTQKSDLPLCFIASDNTI
jgi:hypothetical protein